MQWGIIDGNYLFVWRKIKGRPVIKRSKAYSAVTEYPIRRLGGGRCVWRRACRGKKKELLFLLHSQQDNKITLLLNNGVILQ